MKMISEFWTKNFLIIGLFQKKLAYPYEKFNKIEDYDLDISNLTKQDYYSKLKNGYPDNEEIQRTNTIIKLLTLKMERN